ncbi:MAG: helix-turn-helix transcriptional regulator [Verrucomicrobiota bacterium]
MTNIAKEVLFARLMRSGLAEQTVNDFFQLTGIEIEIATSKELPKKNRSRFSVPFFVGKVQVAAFLCPADLPADQRNSLKRLLAMVAEALGNRILYQSEGVLGGALPGQVMLAARLLREKGTQGHITLGMIADQVGLGRERLSRLFHASLGITFSEYLNQVRLDHCRELLRNSRKPITDCAFESGFQSLSQFNRRFKAAEGITPGEYRRRSFEKAHFD